MILLKKVGANAIITSAYKRVAAASRVADSAKHGRIPAMFIRERW
jgi:hypothetical protein